MVDVKTNFANVNPLSFNSNKSEGCLSVVEKSVKKDNFEQIKKPNLSTSSANNFSPVVLFATHQEKSHPFLQGNLPKIVPQYQENEHCIQTVELPVELQRKLEEEILKLKPVVCEQKEDELLLADQRLEEPVELQMELDKAFEAVNKIMAETLNHGSVNYTVHHQFISNILSDISAKGLLVQHANEIFKYHLNYLIENDPKINQNKKLLQKYEQLAKELEETCNTVNYTYRTTVSEIFRNGKPDQQSLLLLKGKTLKQSALFLMECCIIQTAEEVSLSIKKNDRQLINFDVPGHVILIEFEKEKDDEGYFNGHYTVRIFNGGDGVENHQNYFDPLAENKKNGGKIKYDTCVTIKNINQEKLKKEDIEYLFNFSAHSSLRPNEELRGNWFSSFFEKDPIHCVYSFFKTRGEEEIRIINSSQSIQKVGNCTTRGFNSFFHNHLNGPGEYSYFMATLLRNIRENNPTSTEFVQKLIQKEEKNKVKEKEAIHKASYMKKMEMTNIFQLIGSQRLKHEDDDKLLKNDEDATLYYQKDSENLFLILKGSKDHDFTVYYLKFSSDQEEPEKVLIGDFFTRKS